jgi:hypothetical protein
MRRAITPVLIAVLLGAAGGYAWMRAAEERRLAEGRQALVTMQFGAAMPTAGDQASANYWLAKYDALAQDHDASGAVIERDPEVLFIAANAAYRALDAAAANRAQRLDSIIKSYAEVMKNDGAAEDAAYNYELLARQREAIGRTRGIIGAPAAPATRGSIHGHEGSPPERSDASTLKIVVPKRSDERNEELKSGASPVRNRKG